MKQIMVLTVYAIHILWSNMIELVTSSLMVRSKPKTAWITPWKNVTWVGELYKLLPKSRLNKISEFQVLLLLHTRECLYT